MRHQENCGRKARGLPLPRLQAPAESPLGAARQEWGCRNCKLGPRCCCRKELLGPGCRPRLGQFHQKHKPTGSRAGPSRSLGACWCPLRVGRSQAAQSRPASERGCRAEYRDWGLVTCPQLCSVKIRVQCRYSVTHACETYARTAVIWAAAMLPPDFSASTSAKCSDSLFPLCQCQLF